MSRIRPFLETDLDAVVYVFRSNIPKYFGPEEEDGLRNFLADARADEYFVLEHGGEIVGAGGIALNDDETVSLCWGMIQQDHLGTGLGKELTQFRMRLAAERYPHAALVTSTSQHTSGFYEKFGFVTVEHTVDGFGPGIDICKMRKEN